ncbi:MAG: hypothetical protein WD749_05075 [Phycisphaerales bacterium]
MNAPAAPSPPSRSRAAPALALALIPLLALAVSAWVAWSVQARAVAAYYDPDYHYLLNSLMLAEGHAPRHIDHPGTPLQELGAAVLLARHHLGLGPAGDGPLREGILRDPESALTAISVCLRLLFAGALYLLGLRARELTGGLGAALAAQGASLLSMIGLLSLWRVSPEPLVMTLSLLTACITLRLARGPGAPGRFVALAGIIAGVGVATKVTFIPLLLVPLRALATRGRVAAYAAVSALAFVVAVAPILGQHERLLGWFGRLAANDGVYGRSEGHAIVNPSRYAGDLWRMIREEPAAIIAAAISAALLVHLGRSGRWRSLPPRERAIAGTLGLVALVQVLQYLLVAKHAGDRYLLPALMLLGLNIALGHALLSAAYPPAIRRRASAAALVLMLGYAAWLGIRLERRLADQREQSTARLALHALSLRTARAEGGVLACAYPSSSPVFALVFADWWTANRFGPDLREMYPGQWNYNVWGKTYSVGARQLPKQRATDQAARGTLFFQGVRDVLPAEFDYQELGRAGEEGLYRAVPRPGP